MMASTCCVSLAKIAKSSDKNEINGGENRKKEERKVVGQNTRRKINISISISISILDSSLILKQSLERKKQLVKKKRASKKTAIAIKTAGIVCTVYQRNEVRELQAIVKKLGKFIFELNVTPMTTHLVVGEVKRTLNLLKAIVRGCWILKSEWVSKSLEAKRWLPEEDFELTEFSPAVQNCRKERQAFGSTFSMDIFAKCGPIYVSKNLEAPYIKVRELVRLCKGDACNLRRTAKIVVGEYVNDEEVVCVNQKWIFDSIVSYQQKSFRQYLLKDNEF